MQLMGVIHILQVTNHLSLHTAHANRDNMCACQIGISCRTIADNSHRPMREHKGAQARQDDLNA